MTPELEWMIRFAIAQILLGITALAVGLLAYRLVFFVADAVIGRRRQRAFLARLKAQHERFKHRHRDQ